MAETFRQRLTSGEQLLGTWLKTPSPIVAEVLGKTALDCVCIDAEHAPFDRGNIDSCVAAFRAERMPTLVRIPKTAPEHALNALDCGADGIVAPHVASLTDAKALAKMCRYGAGGRGYAGSSRAAGYTTSPMSENLRRGNEDIAVIAQIEDLPALEKIDAIAGVEGIDCLFVGRIDLTVALGAATPDEPEVIEAVERICAASRNRGRTVGMFVGNLDEIPRWQDAGASLFILQSDHNFLLDGARRLRAAFDG